MFRRLQKMLPVLLSAVLLGVCFLAGSAVASECEHSWGDWTGENGLHRRECSLCHRIEDGECTYYSIVLRPTCTEGGYTKQTCTLCNDVVQTNPTDPAGHRWNDGVCTLQPTCAQDGEMLFTCTVCAEEKTQSLAATGKHTVVIDAAVAATCTQTGLTDGAHCAVCNEVIVQRQEVPKKAHEWDMQNIVTVTPPTCTDGLEQTKCKHCDAVGTRPVPAVQEHGYVVTVLPVNPTCTADGHTETAICPTCKTVMKHPVVLPAKGHNWDVMMHVEPTCDEDGFCDRSCDRCGAKEQYVRIPAAGHDYVVQSAKAPTCTENGYSASCACSICGDVLASRETVKALGHDFKSESKREATCTVNGMEVLRCTRCAETKTQTSEKLGHDLAVASTTPATCTKAGLVLKKCNRCAHTLTQSLQALGHDEIYDKTPATCTEGGYTSVSCSRCDYTDRINFTSPAGHKGVLVQQVKPTCTQGGYDAYACSVCGYEYQQNLTQMTEHTWAPGLITQPTCTEDGYTSFQCLYCKQTKTSNTVPATGHKLDNPVAGGNGTHAGACSVCLAAVSEPCSGGVLSCLQKAVCAVCGGSYGNPTGKHSFTKWTSINNSLHRLDCADCDTVGESTEKHAFQQGDFIKEIRAFGYTCKQCAHKVWGRPIGDANGDGEICTVNDARAALRYAVGLDTPREVDRSAADADRDGNVTTADARLLLRASVGLEEVKRSVLFVDENGNLPN